MTKKRPQDLCEMKYIDLLGVPQGWLSSLLYTWCLLVMDTKISDIRKNETTSIAPADLVNHKYIGQLSGVKTL